MVYTSTTYSANPPDRGPCDAPRWVRVKPSSWTKKLIAGLVRCAVKRWPVPGGGAFAVRVFDCESGLYPWAVGGDNLGVAQHKARYWLGRVNAYLHRDWFSRWQWTHVHQEASVDHPQPAFNARANVIAGIKMAHSGGWSPWACA